MADFSSYDTTDSPTGPEKPRTVGLKIVNDIDVLRRMGFGDVVTKVEGYLQVYEGADNRMSARIVRADDPTFTVKEALAGEYILREELDCEGINGVELKNARPKGIATGSLLAVAAANEAVLEYDLTLKRLALGAKSGDRRAYLSKWDLDGGHFKRQECTIVSTTTASTAVRDDVDVHLLPNGTDEIRWYLKKAFPYDFAVKDAYLEIFSRLEAAEASGDEIDLQSEYETAVIGTDTFGGTLTTKVNETQTLGAGTAAGTLHRTLIKLPVADATNPLAADALIRGIIKRNGLTNVGNIGVASINLLIHQFGGVDHQI